VGYECSKRSVEETGERGPELTEQGVQVLVDKGALGELHGWVCCCGLLPGCLTV
jgi:hypothetical protein